MRLIPSSTALPHAMISIAALHEARRKTEGFFIKSESPQSAGSYDSPVYSDHRATIDEDPCAVYDSLKHKQYALKQIQNEISNPDYRNIEGTIASILLLVWQDLMESGTDSWRYHLQALKEVAELQRSPINIHPVRSLSIDFGSLVRYFEMTYAA